MWRSTPVSIERITSLLLRALRWNNGVVDAVVCGDDVSQGRPAPYLIFRAMEMTGTHSVHDVMNVGDTSVDLQAGNNAGVRWNVGVLSGAHDRDRLTRVPHTGILGSVVEVMTLLRGRRAEARRHTNSRAIAIPGVATGLANSRAITIPGAATGHTNSRAITIPGAATGLANSRAITIPGVARHTNSRAITIPGVATGFSPSCLRRPGVEQPFRNSRCAHSGPIASSQVTALSSCSTVRSRQGLARVHPEDADDLAASGPRNPVGGAVLRGRRC